MLFQQNISNLLIRLAGVFPPSLTLGTSLQVIGSILFNFRAISYRLGLRIAVATLLISNLICKINFPFHFTFILYNKLLVLIKSF